MVTLLLVSEWGSFSARTIVEMSESQAEPLLSTGVAVPVDIAPPFVGEPVAEVTDSAPAKPVRAARKSR